MEFIIALLAALGGLAIGAGAGYYGRSLVSKKRIGQAEFASTRIVEDAKEQSRAILIEAKEESLELRREGESEIREQRSEIKQSERRLANREENLERRGSNLEKRERSLTESEREAEELQSDLESLKDQADTACFGRHMFRQRGDEGIAVADFPGIDRLQRLQLTKK